MDGTLDCFYLGQIPALGNGRHRARLDSLHTINTPKAAQRRAVLEKCRIARLSRDFRRDLHVRLFSAFSLLGFDDISWYSDQDLEWVVKAGETEASSLAEACVRAKSSGQSMSPAEKALEQHKSRLTAFKAEWIRRNPGMDTVPPEGT